MTPNNKHLHNRPSYEDYGYMGEDFPFEGCPPFRGNGQTCPVCGSHNILTTDNGQRRGKTIGALGGAAAGVAGTLSGAKAGSAVGATVGFIAGPVGVPLGTAAGAFLGGLAGAVSGSFLGAKVGQVVDDTFLDNLRCRDCGHAFSATLSD